MYKSAERCSSLYASGGDSRPDFPSSSAPSGGVVTGFDPDRINPTSGGSSGTGEGLHAPRSSNTAAQIVDGDSKIRLDDIDRHPLFPLLEDVFKKCELATHSGQECMDYSPSSKLFNEKIECFRRTGGTSYQGISPHRDNSMFSEEVDDLMLQAIQVFRFQLLELEKVHQLCDTFCQRYISCLKGKMPVDLMVEDRDTPPGDRRTSTASEASLQDPLSPPNKMRSPPSTSDLYSSSNAGGRGSYPFSLPHTQSHHSHISDSHLGASSVPPSCSGGGYPSTHGLSLSSGGGACDPASNFSDNGADCMEQSSLGSPLGSDDQMQRDGGKGHRSNSSSSSSSTAGTGSSRRKGTFSKEATDLLRAWLFQHITHPYPSEEQKRQLAQDTRLTILQVNNWFINARRRIVQPMQYNAGPLSPGALGGGHHMGPMGHHPGMGLPPSYGTDHHGGLRPPMMHPPSAAGVPGFGPYPPQMSMGGYPGFPGDLSASPGMFLPHHHSHGAGTLPPGLMGHGGNGGVMGGLHGLGGAGLEDSVMGASMGHGNMGRGGMGPGM